MSLNKTILGSTAIISISALATRSLGLITAPIMTRLLGPAPYGTVALLGTLVNLGATLALFGRELGYSRFGLQGDAGARRHVETHLWRSVLFSAAVLSIAFSLIWIFLKQTDDTNDQTLSIYIALGIIFSSALAMASVRRRLAGQYFRIAATSVIASILGICVSIGWALAISRDAWALAAGLLTTSVVNFVLLGAPNPLHLIKPSGLDRQRRMEVLSLGLSSVVTAPIYWVIMSADRWILNSYAGETEVGVYAFAAQFGLLGALINNGLMATWLTETNRTFEVHGTAALPSIGTNCTRLMTGLLVVWMAISAGGGDALRLLAPPPFHRGTILIPWIGAGVLLYGISSLFVASLFIRGRMRFMAIAWIVGGMAGITSYIVLAPRFGALGVAIGQAIAFALIALVTWIASLRVLAIPLPYLRLAMGFAAALVCVCALSPQWFVDPMQSLVAKAPVGTLAAALVVTLISPKPLSFVFTRLVRRPRSIRRDE